MDTQLLREQGVPPTKEVIANALGASYGAYTALMETVMAPPLGLTADWNYYKDGRAWLCKVCYKKKTVFWLSIWDGFFKVGFYFTLKNCSGIVDMDIDERIKDEFGRVKAIGKLLPLTVNVDRMEKLKDVVMIAEYKKGLKA